MTRANIIEQTEADVIAANERIFFRPVFATTPAIPETYDGKYVNLLAVATNVSLTEEQMDQLETAIEAITGVYKAFCLIGPARIPIDRVPAGNDLKIGVEGRFMIDPTSVE